MPSVKDFKNSDQKKNTETTETEVNSDTASVQKRRPGRDAIEAGVEAEPVAMSASESDYSESRGETFESVDESVGPVSKNKITDRLNQVTGFLKDKFPDSYQLVEAVAKDWQNEGRFEALPVKHPLAQYVLGQGLRKAKEIEKKVMESPVTEKVAMKAFETAIKAQGLKEQVKGQIKDLRAQVKKQTNSDQS